MQPVLILGMHRSGTSCLTGCLEEAGLFLGEVNTAAPFNRKGNRENMSVMAIHNSVLEAAGAAWDDPPARPLEWREEDLSDLAAVIDAYPRERRWGVKDPRVLFTLPGWRRLSDPVHVGTFRHPLEVAQSLLSRAEAWNQPMDEDGALDLWRRYNERLLAEHERAPFALIEFGDPDYQEKLKRICREIGLSPPARFAFFDKTLRHNRAETPAVPGHLREVWERLQDAAL